MTTLQAKSIKRLIALLLVGLPLILTACGPEEAEVETEGEALEEEVEGEELEVEEGEAVEGE